MTVAETLGAELFGELRPLGEGSWAATIASRPTLVTVLEGESVAPERVFAAFARAAALSLPSIVLIDGGLGDRLTTLPRIEGAATRVLVATVATAAVDAAFSALGILRVGIGAESGALLAAQTLADAAVLAAVLLGYLPAAAGDSTPVFAAHEQPEVTSLAEGHGRNALSTLYSLFDDVLRLWPHAGDDVVFAVARVAGRSLAVVIAQPLAGAGHASARLAPFLELASDRGLPIVVLGGLPDVDPPQLHAAARAIAAHESPLVLVADGSSATGTDELLEAAPTAVRIDAADGLRAALSFWASV